MEDTNHPAPICYRLDGKASFPTIPDAKPIWAVPASPSFAARNIATASLFGYRARGMDHANRVLCSSFSVRIMRPGAQRMAYVVLGAGQNLAR